MIYFGVTEYFSQLHCGNDLTNVLPTIGSQVTDM